MDDKSQEDIDMRSYQEAKGNFKGLTSFTAGSGQSVHVTTISQALHKAGLYGRVARKKPFLKKCCTQSRLRYAKTHLEESDTFRQKVLWSDENKILHFGLICKLGMERFPV